ncbi:hypothetical protein [Nannocystis bainbridge]|uniref:Uncharacterized protein n=1 Tax=Nannocystis bainbridge TaxID=2995303 RepID=A0ABT5E001_9BACT|nr:hypothetical protein [Nannocystis bainbridge]MDC0719164.1 hypothetical protein [Nannocystis bainbridge]
MFGTTSITGQAGAYLRDVFCGPTTVPSSNATSLDNYGVRPIEAPPPGQCELLASERGGPGSRRGASSAA